MRFCLLLFVVLLFTVGCAGTPKVGEKAGVKDAVKKGTVKGETKETSQKEREEEKTEKKEEKTEELDKRVAEALRLWEEFYRKRLLERKFDYELLVRAIEAFKVARKKVRESLALSPSDEKLRDFSFRIETRLSKLREEKIAYDLEKRAEKETEQLIERGRKEEGKKPNEHKETEEAE